VIAIEELLGRKSSGSSLENEIMVIRIRHTYHATPLYQQKLEVTLPTSDGCLIGIVHSWTKATELLLLLLFQRERDH
jgi:hypothetical protein